MSAVQRALRLTGVILPLTVGLFVLAVLVHATTDLPAAYSWLDPWRILRGVLARPHLPTVLVAAYLLGRYRRRGEWDYRLLARRLREPPEREVLLRLLLGAALALALLTGDALLFPHHTALDHVALGAVSVALAFRRPGRAQVTAFVGNLVLFVVVFTLCCYVFTIFKAMLFKIEPMAEVAVGGPLRAGWMPEWAAEVVRRLPAYDETILRWEEAIFGEPPHRAVARWTAAHPEAFAFFDEVYFYLFDHMFIVSVFLIGARLASSRTEYLSALTLCYLVGGLTYHALPAVGPGFWEPWLYEYLGDRPSRTGPIAWGLFLNTGGVVEGGAQQVRTFHYIACMPSLHMAHELVMLWYARRSRLALVLSVAFTAATFVAIMALGFHYAIDALGGLALAAFAVWVASRQRHQLFPAALASADEPLPPRVSALRELARAWREERRNAPEAPAPSVEPGA